MKKIIPTFFILLIAVTTNYLAADKAKIDEPAPNFKLVDSNGKEHSLSDYKGKYVVLEWINFDCPYFLFMDKISFLKH